MRFVSFEIAGQPSYGLWTDEKHWMQVPETFQAQYPDLKSVIAADKLDELERVTRQSNRVVTSSEARLLPVIANPSKIFCVGLNYKTHVAEMKRADSEHPAIFTRFADSLSAHGAPLPKPAATKRFDFEGELAVIIGRPCRNSSVQDALKHVAGYTIANDLSARDAMKRGFRCVRIIHGKGLGSLNKKPVLKNKVRNWLVQKEEVIAFCQARAADGGSGALMVLLKG